MVLRCQYFLQLPVGVAGGVYELPCRIGEVRGPFENTKKLLPAHSPSISLALGIFLEVGERIFLIATSKINGHPEMQTLQTADHADCADRGVLASSFTGQWCRLQFTTSGEPQIT